MTDFTRYLVSIGDDLKSTLLMLETQYPQMDGRVTLSWLEHVARVEK